MNVDEFLRSAHRPRRTKINAFDAEIRQLRAQGVSYQGIADFLRLNNVETSGRAVNKYFERHPNQYRASKPSTARKGRRDDPRADERSQSIATDVSPRRHVVTAEDSTLDDADRATAPTERTDGRTSPSATHATSDHDAVVGGASRKASSDRTSMNDTPNGKVHAGPTDSATPSNSRNDAARHAFPQKTATDAPYHSTEISQAPSVATTMPERPDVGANPFNDLFRSVDFNTPDFLAARKNVRNGQ
ncbi:hypothetical protein VSR68_07980 [Paraburkholderia phymatum]|uniref:hypothetical protein n=1 Tax=Paraburkholderia phymatum TaxID=148447 RepID=UPI00317FF357